MDPVTLIVTALAAGSSGGALEALKDDVKDAIEAACATLRGLVRNRVCDQPGAELMPISSPSRTRCWNWWTRSARPKASTT